MNKDLKQLIGKTLTRVEHNKLLDEIEFEAPGERWRMFYEPACYIEDIVGDLSDLVGAPIVMAECVTNQDAPPGRRGVDSTYTWTFYKLATVKGYVTIRWFGTSNGYYSEEASFERIR